MIHPHDSEFHERDPADRTWTETTFLPFAVPEEGIFGNAYVLARPNMGVVISSIVVTQGFCRQPYEMDFLDPQMHLPCPESFSRYTLANGLSVEATEAPRDYHLTYENALGACSFDLQFRGLHRPFDPHDPKENPLLAQTSQQPADPRLGTAWSNGHFEVKGHITGELTLRGKRFKVDCYDGMDHSWGPRPELGTRSVSWISLNFGDDLAFHLAVPMTIRHGEVSYDALRFGFVVDKGEVHGLLEAQVQATRVDMMPMSNHIRIRDARGKEYEFYGSAVGGHPWYVFNPSHVCYQSLMRYQHGNRVGYGEFGDIFGLDYLGDRMSRTGRHKQ
jgi:hypothetical protein